MKISLALLLVCGAAGAALFEDALKEKPGDGWTWIREDPADWRATGEGIEIRLQPGDANTVRTALVRNVPATEKKLAIEVTVTSLTAPTEQYEQAGLTWYQDDKPVFKLVHERVDGKLVVVPGKIAAEKLIVRLRLVVGGGKFTAQYQQEGEQEFKTAAEGDLVLKKGDKISLQGYHGPADSEHWVRFSDFKITEEE